MRFLYFAKMIEYQDPNMHNELDIESVHTYKISEISKHLLYICIVMWGTDIDINKIKDDKLTKFEKILNSFGLKLSGTPSIYLF